MELKEILSHAEAVQFLLYSIQHGKQTRTALKKALPKDVPTDALLDAMTDFGFLCRDGKQFRLNQERLEQLRQFLQLYTAVQNQTAEQDFTHFLTAQREQEIPHAMLGTELAFFESVVSGNSDTVHLLYSPLGGKGYGKLSEDPTASRAVCRRKRRSVSATCIFSAPMQQKVNRRYACCIIR